jgi:hypothetical protein
VRDRDRGEWRSNCRIDLSERRLISGSWSWACPLAWRISWGNAFMSGENDTLRIARIDRASLSQVLVRELFPKSEEHMRSAVQDYLGLQKPV